MSFHIDMSDFLDFADDCERAAAKVPETLGNVAHDVGTIAQQRIQRNAKPHRKTGRMENSITPPVVSVSAARATAEVAVTAVSGTGFPYPVVIDQGHGGIVPKGKKALSFVGSDGNRYTVKRVKPYAGSKFFTRAVEETQADSDVMGTVEDEVESLLIMLRG